MTIFKLLLAALASETDAEPTEELTDELVFGDLSTSLSMQIHMTLWGVLFEAAILGWVFAKLPRYYAAFWKADPTVSKVFVVLGAAVLITQMGLSIWQLLILLNVQAHATTYIAHFYTIIAVGMTVGLWNMLFNAYAAIYFSRRAWKLLEGYKWITIPWFLALFASIALQLMGIINGYRMPKIHEVAELEALLEWFASEERLYPSWRAWAGLSAAVDFCVCFTMLVVLTTHKREFDLADKSLLRRLLQITVESMLAPVAICVALFVIYLKQQDTDGALVLVLGPTIYISVLFSLLSRKSLASALSGNNPHKFSGGTHSRSRIPQLHGSGETESSKDLNPSSQPYEASVPMESLNRGDGREKTVCMVSKESIQGYEKVVEHEAIVSTPSVHSENRQHPFAV